MVLRKHDSDKFPCVWKDLGPHPVMVRSKAHLRDICEERGLVSAYLENETYKGLRSGPAKRTYVYDRKTGHLVEKGKCDG